MQMWAEEPGPGADVGGGEPSPGADVAGASPVPAPMWAGVSPSPGADAGRGERRCGADPECTPSERTSTLRSPPTIPRSDVVNHIWS